MGSYWLQPLSPAEVNREAEASVQAWLSPLLGQLFRSERRGRRSIARGGRQLQRRLKPLAKQTRREYGQILAKEAAIADALAASAGGGAGGLEAALSSIDPATAAHFAGQIRGQGQALGNTATAFGSSGLQQLLQTGGAETAYARKLPGIAGMATQKGIADLHAAAMAKRGDILAQAGEMRASERSRLRSEQIALAQSNRAYQADQAGGGPGGFSQKERIEGMEDAVDAGAELAQDLISQTRREREGTFGKERDVPAPVPYEQAVQQVRALIGPGLKALGYSPAAINAAVRRAMTIAGYSQGDRRAAAAGGRSGSTFGPGGLFPLPPPSAGVAAGPAFGYPPR